MQTFRRKASSGFTLVELLIVIVVIGILASISFVGYANISNRAQDSARRTTETQLIKAIRVSETLNGKMLPVTTTTKTNYLNHWNAQGISDEVRYYYEEQSHGAASDRLKVYFQPSFSVTPESVATWRWSNKDNAWLWQRISSDGSTTNGTGSEGPHIPGLDLNGME